MPEKLVAGGGKKHDPLGRTAHSGLSLNERTLSFSLSLHLRAPACYRRKNFSRLEFFRPSHFFSALNTIRYAMCQSPPPLSLTMSSSSTGMILSSSNSTHFPSSCWTQDT